MSEAILSAILADGTPALSVGVNGYPRHYFFVYDRERGNPQPMQNRPSIKRQVKVLSSGHLHRLYNYNQRLSNQKKRWYQTLSQ